MHIFKLPDTFSPEIKGVFKDDLQELFPQSSLKEVSVLYFLEKGSLGGKQGGRKKENSKNIFYSHDPPIFQLLAAVRNGISKVGLPLSCPSGARRGNSSCAAILREQASSTRQKR